jgi:uncharacterized damage-inducible protein DinB
MGSKTVQVDAFSAKLIGLWEQAGQKLETLGEAFPEAKYDQTPGDGMRTFSEVLRHVAFWNLYVADTLRGKKANDTANELPSAKYSTKGQILKALKETTADAATALREKKAGLEPETVELVVAFVAHASEHYGQLVTYARRAGIVPPASRG